MTDRDLAALEGERAERWAGGDALAEQATVSRRELEQRPVEVHAAVAHAVRHVELVDVRQARQHGVR